MTNATLRRSGGSLIMTIPSAFAEQNHLSPGDSVVVDINGQSMTITAFKQPRQRYDLEELVAATAPEFFRPVWEDVQPEGQEIW
ncbi:AbrB/MazE/SpoVT family DNA-binding domain-containing protein [Chromobacterium haemolyticum]|nr:AbrB/MazE/SpoVT family DNA-binding domain-containing protein [Chromobacterium haemolyticum]